jgi:ComF family protein
MGTIWNDFIHLFFPRVCVLCRDLLRENEAEICLSCLHELPYTGYYLEADNPVINLFAATGGVAHASAFLRYERDGKTQQLIYALKYKENKSLAYHLGRLAALAMPLSLSPYPPIDALIPVPLHPKKQRERGYNQAEHICMGLASVWGLPLRTDILQRCVHTPSQTSKSPQERKLNMQGAFRLTDVAALSGLHVLLVDDVITSGATLSSCIETLQLTPGIQVSALALSIA